MRKIKSFFKKHNDHTVIIRHSEEIRRTLLFIGIPMLLSVSIPLLIDFILQIFGKKVEPDIGFDIYAIIFFLIAFIGVTSVFASFFFKPVFATFNRDTSQVSFHSAKFAFNVPFSSIRFVTNRIPTGRGISSIVVSVYTVSNTPLFPGQKIKNQLLPVDHYETLLCTYRCRSNEEAEESIEQLQRFMGALSPEPD